MGQYHITVNLDKRQYLMPHRLGNGLKLLEQMGSNVPSALFLLLAVSNGRGGGDFNDDTDNELIGSWGGDRIAVLGDYAEPDDLAPEFRAELIYGFCREWDDEDLDGTRRWWEEKRLRYGTEDEYEPSMAEKYGMTFEEYLAQARQWRDISDDLVPLLEKYLGIKFVTDDGWRNFVETCWEHPDKARGHRDHQDEEGGVRWNSTPAPMSDEDLDLQLRLGTPPEILGITKAEAKIRNYGKSRR